MYRLIDLKSVEEFSKSFIDGFEKSFKVRKISDSFIQIKTRILDGKMFQNLNDMNIKIVYDEIVYEAEDVDDYDFFYLSGQKTPDTSIQLSSAVANNLGKFFDLTKYCSKCRLGMVQTENLQFKGNFSKVLDRKFITSFWSFWFISNVVKKSLEDSNLTGIRFLPVYNSKGIVVKDIFQIVSQETFSGMIKTECLIPRIKYKECGCNNYTYVFKDLNKIKLNGFSKNVLHDFNEIEERSDIYKGICIVSKKFVKEFIKIGLLPDKHFMIWPVCFE